MKLYIKNMVCNRCKYVVETELQRMGYFIIQSELGEITIAEELKTEEIKKVSKILFPFGFELIDSQNSKLIERIKKKLIELSQPNSVSKKKLSVILSDSLTKDYTYLSNLFSEVEGQTIEKYFINLKIEKVKEQLMYNEFSLSEIAWQMGYSSVSHLSKQFKDVTGFTTTHFKQLKERKRKSLDNL